MAQLVQYGTFPPQNIGFLEGAHPIGLTLNPLYFSTRAAIPPSGAFYAFCHSPATGEVEAAAAEKIEGLVLHDPLVAWLLTGAYVYFGTYINMNIHINKYI